jgi:hypothetical protein
MSQLQIAGAAFALLSGIVGAVIGVESRYEKASAAEHVHELLAAENETARLETQLAIVKIRLEKYVELAKVRPLTESEQIELRAVEKERDTILQRLAAKG